MYYSSLLFLLYNTIHYCTVSCAVLVNSVCCCTLSLKSSVLFSLNPTRYIFLPSRSSSLIFTCLSACVVVVFGPLTALCTVLIFLFSTSYHINILLLLSSSCPYFLSVYLSCFGCRFSCYFFFLKKSFYSLHYYYCRPTLSYILRLCTTSLSLISLVCAFFFTANICLSSVLKIIPYFFITGRHIFTSFLFSSTNPASLSIHLPFPTFIIIKFLSLLRLFCALLLDNTIFSLRFSTINYHTTATAILYLSSPSYRLLAKVSMSLLLLLFVLVAAAIATVVVVVAKNIYLFIYLKLS